MRLTSQRLERCGMYLLAAMPIYGLITHFLIDMQLLGIICLSVEVIICCLISAMPAYVGNYSETEIIRYEGGINRGDDPNPDRESRHETIRSGKRFPLRSFLYILIAILSLAALILLPANLYKDSYALHRFVFIALSIVFEIICMGSINAETCIWTELPGIGIGFVGYLVAALYLYFAGESSGVFPTVLGVFALIFLFGAFICLNRASLSNEASTDADKRKVPKALERRNRNIVLIFAAIIALISFVKPVRDAAIWVLRWVLVFFKWLGWLLRGGKDVDKGDLNRILAMQGFGEETEMLPEEIEALEEEMEQIQESPWDKVIVIGFLVLLAIGVLFIIYAWATKKLKRDGYIFKRRAKNAGEGYYDEKETLESDEIRKKYSNSLKNRLKNLLKRETPWEKLSAREKARRLVKKLYLKQRGIDNIANLTAREALSKMPLKEGLTDKTANAYDVARYSEQEPDSNKMDELRKELRL